MLRFSSLFYFWLSFKRIEWTCCTIKKIKACFIANLTNINMIKVY